MVRPAVPDIHNEIVDLVAACGRVAVRLLCSGHHHSGLLGYAGRGQRFEYSGAAFFCCIGARLSSAWVVGDIEALRQEIET